MNTLLEPIVGEPNIRYRPDQNDQPELVRNVSVPSAFKKSASFSRVLLELKINPVDNCHLWGEVRSFETTKVHWRSMHGALPSFTQNERMAIRRTRRYFDRLGQLVRLEYQTRFLEKRNISIMDYSLSIMPGINPADRHKLEDKLDGFLSQFGGETTGGGTMLDGSESDLDFECENAGFIDGLQAFLTQNSNINAKITLKCLDDSTEIFSVNCIREKKWWQFW